MTTLIIAITAFAASMLTLFSGFGLGTMLMPVIAIFFPVTVAVAMTALVHGLNSLFKLSLLWKHVHWRTVWIFGLPAIIATVPGAWLLTHLAALPDITTYNVFDIKDATITPVNVAVGILLCFFATAEWIPFLKKMDISEKALPWGGVLSGFFGGLSGHQGAFRSAFLIRIGLDKNQFVACNAAIAALIDITRLAVYGISMTTIVASENITMLSVATVAAFVGAIAGTAFLKKITIDTVQMIVVIGLYILGALLMAGLL